MDIKDNSGTFPSEVKVVQDLHREGDDPLTSNRNPPAELSVGLSVEVSSFKEFSSNFKLVCGSKQGVKHIDVDQIPLVSVVLHMWLEGGVRSLCCCNSSNTSNHQLLKGHSLNQCLKLIKLTQKGLLWI
jgi:hypothetical protein